MSERLDRVETILITVAEQTAANSVAILGINQTLAATNQTLQTLAQEQVIINQTLQNVSSILQEVSRETRQNTRDIAQLVAAIDQQRRTLDYLLSKD